MDGLLLNVASMGLAGAKYANETLSKLAEGNESIVKKVAAVAMLALVAYHAFTTFIVGVAIGSFAVMNEHWSGEQTARIYKKIEEAISTNSALALVAVSYFFPTMAAIPLGFATGSLGMQWVQSISKLQ